MAIRIFPEAVRQMQASKAMRLRHELWHFVRAVWGHPLFPEEGRDILRNMGWELPGDRMPRRPDGTLILDNFAGEDFLFMHREMIAMTDQALAATGEPPISRWSDVPEPGSSDFPVPPAWEYADPAQSPEDNASTTAFLKNIKSEEYFERTMLVRARFMTDSANLARLSLGALGNVAEMTIHNMMHMRWSADPGSYRPQINLNDPIGGDPQWDDLSYDYLGDTYSSHVNPHFWYLHGWIDNLIDAWAAARGLSEITWTGTWTGGPDLDEHHIMAATADGLSASVRRLNQITAGLPIPRTLIEIARQGEPIGS